MTLNYIWIGFFLIAFIVGIIRVLGYYFREFFANYFHLVFDATDFQVFEAMMQSTFSSAELAVDLCFGLIGAMSLWLGIMRIGEEGGAIRVIARIVGPFFQRLFPSVPKDHPAIGSMIMNFSANMLGLDNAATPLGLKAMDQLQEINPNKEEASDAQIMFLVLNTSGLTLIPVSVMALRASAGAANPADVFLPILIATFFATLVGLIGVSIRQKINVFHPIIIGTLVGISLFIGGLLLLFDTMEPAEIGRYSSLISSVLLLGVITSFIGLAVRKKVNVYEVFIEGAKDGFQIAIKIIPYLVAMLVGVAVFRASGALDIITDSIKYAVIAVGLNSDFVDALPTAMMKPLSGGGARGLMAETMQEFGVESFAARLAGTFQGSTETTFYTVAVYYGAVAVKKTRYTIGYGLLADLAGIIAAIFVAYLFFH